MLSAGYDHTTLFFQEAFDTHTSDQEKTGQKRCKSDWSVWERGRTTGLLKATHFPSEVMHRYTEDRSVFLIYKWLEHVELFASGIWNNLSEFHWRRGGRGTEGRGQEMTPRVHASPSSSVSIAAIVPCTSTTSRLCWILIVAAFTQPAVRAPVPDLRVGANKKGTVQRTHRRLRPFPPLSASKNPQNHKKLRSSQRRWRQLLDSETYLLKCVATAAWSSEKHTTEVTSLTLGCSSADAAFVCSSSALLILMLFM